MTWSPEESDITSINGWYYDQTSVRVAVGGIKLGYSIKDVSFSEKLTPTIIRDSHPVRAGTGVGMHEADASLSLQQEVWQQLQAKLIGMVQGDTVALTLLTFELNIAFIVPGGSAPTLIDIKQARIIGRGLDGITGQEGLVRKIPLTVQQILENGIPLAPRRLP